MLYNEDCLERMPKLYLEPTVIVTDPPYRLTSGGQGHGDMKGIFDPEHYDNSGLLMDVVPFGDWLDAAFACAAPDCDIYIMVNDKNVFDCQLAMRQTGWRQHNILTWNKVTATPCRWYMKNCEYIIYGWKGKARTINDPSAKQLITCPHADKTDHPTEKPVSLLRHYIGQSTSVDGIVLDPFMGSGSTGVAALQEDREFIGIEKEEKWYNVAVDRYSKALRQQEFRL